MAIVHVAFKSSSKAPPASAHAHYIAREGQYQQRGGVELVESGNMPEFAQADPHAMSPRPASSRTLISDSDAAGLIPTFSQA